MLKNSVAVCMLCAGLSFCAALAPLSAAHKERPIRKSRSFRHHPTLTPEMRQLIKPHLLPSGHPVKAKLDSIFSQTRVLENERTFADAGFTVIAGPMALSYVIVARHPEIPGYVFKLYLDSESRMRNNIPHWLWLVRRCEGALGIRKIIARKKIRRFSVPDKWLYLLPVPPFSSSREPEPVLLVETDMQPESIEVSRQKWQTVVTRNTLDELYSILKAGHGGVGTIYLENNVPFTKKGKFAFTDTEDPKSKLKLKFIKQYLSPTMAAYWDTLIKKR